MTMITLETGRLVIRNFKSSDWEALLEMVNQYETSAFAAYDQPWPTTPDKIKGVTEWFANGDTFVAVCLKDTGRFIGFVGLNPVGKEDSREYTLGYIFNTDYHRKGYASEACRAVINRAFNELQVECVITGTAALNTASRRLLEKLGFKKTSESTGSFKNDADGKPIEFLGYMYALPRKEWEAGKQ